MPGRSRYRDAVTMAFVLVGHAALVWLFIEARRVEQTASLPGPSSTLIFVESPPPDRNSSAPTLLPIPMPATSPTTPQLPEIDASELTDRAPKQIDWQNEAQRAAGAVIEQSREPGPRAFGPRESAPAEKKERVFEWNPEPPRVGMSGLLPYVRVGERCVIGLGFFACGLGDLPAPNGALFDGMDDPNRARSSVPELEE